MPPMRLSMLLMTTVLSVTLCALHAADESASSPYRGDYQVVHLRLDKALGREALDAIIGFRDGQACQAWAVGAGDPLTPFLCQEMASDGQLPELRFEGGRLTGSIAFTHERGASGRRKERATTAVLKIQATGTGSLTGRFEGGVKAGKEQAVSVSGGLTGRVLPAEDLAQINGLAKGLGRPGWRFNAGWGQDSGYELVEDLSQARVAWVSEEVTIPPSYGGVSGGASGPIVVDGRVYLNYNDPNGPTIAEKYRDVCLSPEGREMTAFWARKKASVEADNVVLCLDAVTGRTVWKAVFAAQDLNASNSGRGVGKAAKVGPHIFPCVGDGKVFAMGNTGRVYALDAQTGALLWKREFEAVGRKYEDHKKRRGQFGELIGEGFPTNCTSPVYAEGVVAVSVGSGLTGLDARSGQTIWETQDGTGDKSSAVLWAHEGRSFIIGGTGSCIEPRTGKILWQPETPTASTPSVSRTHLVSRIKDGLICYRISPQGAKELWRLGETFDPEHTCPLIMDGRVFARCNLGKRSTTWVALDLETGEEIAKPAPSGTGGCASIIGADGRVFVQNYYFKADDMTALPTTLGRGDGSHNFSDSHTPCLVDGRLFVRGHMYVICYDLRKRPLVAREKTD